jgi:hypothetical protein
MYVTFLADLTLVSFKVKTVFIGQPTMCLLDIQDVRINAIRLKKATYLPKTF